MSVRNKYNKISTTKTQQQCLVILHQSHNQFSLIQFERCLKFYSNVSKNPTLGIKVFTIRQRQFSHSYFTFKSFKYYTSEGIKFQITGP